MGLGSASTIRLAVAAASLAAILALAPLLDQARGNQREGPTAATAATEKPVPKSKERPPEANAPGRACRKRVKRAKRLGKREARRIGVKCKKRARRKRPGREFFGIQSFEPISLGEAAALRSARVGTLRLALAWPRVERIPGERNWAYSDYQVNLAAREGIRAFRS